MIAVFMELSRRDRRVNIQIIIYISKYKCMEVNNLEENKLFEREAERVIIHDILSSTYR